ncbi:MAG: tyrosine-type recombinase/integrase [Lachnospiraceae bacterium]|nr:tyrosine-type recombinase/integrase [Lachnospiraceae bacterium]
MGEVLNKQSIINQIITDMFDLPAEIRERLKLTLTFRLKDINFTPAVTLPATSCSDNKHILELFATDKLAENCETSTVKSYLYAMRAFFGYTNLHWSSVTGQDIAAYLASRKWKEKISDAYMVSMQKAFCVFFGWLYKRKYIDHDLRDDIPKTRAAQKTKQRLSDDEIERCRIVAANLFERAFLELMLSTGLRVGEIVSLNVEDLDFDHQEIRVYGEKTNQWRIALMSPCCKMHLMNYVGSRKSGPLFVGRRNCRMSSYALERTARGLSIRANCKVTATVHTYRKTYASILYNKTNDVLAVSKMLGHAKTDTTVKYYLVDDIEAMKQKVLRSF